jgi:gas vesicle protein
LHFNLIQEITMFEQSDSNTKFFVTGLVVGSVAAILLAPKSGNETRHYLGRKAEDGKRYARKKALEMKEHAEDLAHLSAHAVTDAREDIQKAVGAGLTAYHREISKSDRAN